MDYKIILVVAAMVAAAFVMSNKNEHFDAVGYVYNIPPNWFIKQTYNLDDWIVTVYPDQIQPECLPYSKQDKYGPMGKINYMSQAYRFWRM